MIVGRPAPSVVLLGRSVSLVAPAFGIALILLGAAFLGRHRRTWRERKNDPSVDQNERAFYFRQYRRRMLTSGLIVLLGVLIPAGDLFFEQQFRQKPAALAFGIYWIGVLLIVLFVLLLGVIDFIVTAMHAKDAIARIQTEKAALERQVEEVRRSLRRETE